MPTQILDTSGLNCPLPILKTKKALKGMAAGETLQLLATDPGSVADIAAFCKQTGNDLIVVAITKFTTTNSGDAGSRARRTQ